MAERWNRSEIERGLAETRKYLLSHHEPSEHYRCYSVSIDNQHVRLCARCSGIYPGIVLGVGLFIYDIASASHFSLIAILPVFALLDWGVTTFRSVRGYNAIRTVTGAFLGIAYGLGLGNLLIGREIEVMIVGGIYGSAAAMLLWVSIRADGGE